MNKLIKKLLFFLGIVFKKKRRVPENVNKILCILPHYLGDTLWMLNAVKLLQKYFPQAEIDVVFRRDFSALLTGIVDKEHILVEPSLVSDRKREKVSLVEIRQAAKKYRKKYDVVTDLGGNRYSALFAHWCRENMYPVLTAMNSVFCTMSELLIICTKTNISACGLL